MQIGPGVWVIAGLLVLSVIFLMSMFAKLFRKAGPHEALVVYGFRGTRIVKGRGTVIFPMIENCRWLSLELMSFDVAPEQQLYTSQGVAVSVEAVSQIKVKSDPLSIRTASEQFLTKAPQEREGLIRLVMEGHLRGIIGQLNCVANRPPHDSETLVSGVRRAAIRASETKGGHCRSFRRNGWLPESETVQQSSFVRNTPGPLPNHELPPGFT